MVVLDSISNGYRHILLPLALQDEVVHRAVSVVAAHHLAERNPKLRGPAATGQMAIISRLRRDACRSSWRDLCTVSTWATILILLVGETVTGGSDFVYLLVMLRCLIEQTGTGCHLPEEVRRFFSQQAKMYVSSSLLHDCSPGGQV